MLGSSGFLWMPGSVELQECSCSRKKDEWDLCEVPSVLGSSRPFKYLRGLKVEATGHPYPAFLVRADL